MIDDRHQHAAIAQRRADRTQNVRASRTWFALVYDSARQCVALLWRHIAAVYGLVSMPHVSIMKALLQQRELNQLM
jgi:hypothetical protein